MPIDYDVGKNESDAYMRPQFRPERVAVRMVAEPVVQAFEARVELNGYRIPRFARNLGQDFAGVGIGWRRDDNTHH